MKPFLADDFLLSTPAANRLYHEYAADQPIFDYHCHLSPKDIAENRQFSNLAEIWLEGDHYKWRILRAAGVDEQYITGNASDYDKYMAWARTMPKALGNPIYHWSHLELKRPFGLTGILLNEQSADYIWQHCNACLSQPAFTARGIMQQMHVRMVGTTDDPLDDLNYHQQIRQDTQFDIAVLPSWRPDSLFKIELPGFTRYLQALGAKTGITIIRFHHLLTAMQKRLDHFAAHGCVSADHGIEHLYYADPGSEQDLDVILARRLAGKALTELDIARFSTAVQLALGREYAKRQWVMQLHLGALRNNNQRMFTRLGPNAGFDSIGDQAFAVPLAQFLSALDLTEELPKTILYTLNPVHNEVIAAMCGNFQDGKTAGKIQFGSGWWFNDQLDGMRRQMTQLAQMGLLSQFIGMLTDSRSFLSYTRHEYFRRLLCDIWGQWMENGEVPHDFELIGQTIQNICYDNPVRYFSLEAD